MTDGLLDQVAQVLLHRLPWELSPAPFTSVELQRMLADVLGPRLRSPWLLETLIKLLAPALEPCRAVGPTQTSAGSSGAGFPRIELPAAPRAAGPLASHMLGLLQHGGVASGTAPIYPDLRPQLTKVAAAVSAALAAVAVTPAALAFGQHPSLFEPRKGDKSIEIVDLTSWSAILAARTTTWAGLSVRLLRRVDADIAALSRCLAGTALWSANTASLAATLVAGAVPDNWHHGSSLPLNVEFWLQLVWAAARFTGSGQAPWTKLSETTWSVDAAVTSGLGDLLTDLTLWTAHKNRVPVDNIAVNFRLGAGPAAIKPTADHMILRIEGLWLQGCCWAPGGWVSSEVPIGLPAPDHANGPVVEAVFSSLASQPAGPAGFTAVAGSVPFHVIGTVGGAAASLGTVTLPIGASETFSNNAPGELLARACSLQVLGL